MFHCFFDIWQKGRRKFPRNSISIRFFSRLVLKLSSTKGGKVASLIFAVCLPSPGSDRVKQTDKYFSWRVSPLFLRSLGQRNFRLAPFEAASRTRSCCNLPISFVERGSLRWHCFFLPPFCKYLFLPRGVERPLCIWLQIIAKTSVRNNNNNKKRNDLYRRK